MASIVSVELGRFSVTVRFDDETRFNVRKKDVTHFSLCPGKVCDSECLAAQISSFQLDDAYESALCSLDVCARTENEIRSKLLRKGFLPAAVDAVCERLQNARLLDDAQIAEKLVSSMNHSGKGKYAIVRKLRSRGISDETSEELISSLDEEIQTESCVLACQRLWHKYYKGDERETKRKLSQALARRGFTWDSIEAALERISSDASD